MAETALVTGATSGIGESLCLLLASDGYNLITVARDKEALKKQADELKLLDIDVMPIACDLSKPDAADSIFKQVQDKGWDVDILVNDAGYSPAGCFAELPEADVRAMIQVSITSLAELANLFVKPMIKRGRGRILNMSSMMAKTPCPYNALYGAAKVFVLSFTTALAYELRGTGVSATTVCPGATRTNFPKNAGIDDAPAWKYFSTDADDTAIRVYRALMLEKPCAVTGLYNKVGAFSTRFMPMGFQLMVGEWLVGTRKHPLHHEGDERPEKGAGNDGKKDEQGGKRPRDASSEENAAPKHEPGHEHGREHEHAQHAEKPEQVQRDERPDAPKGESGKPTGKPEAGQDQPVSPFIRVTTRSSERDAPEQGSAPSCNANWNLW